MQLKFGYDLKPKVWDESGGYAFAIVFRVEILRKRKKKSVKQGPHMWPKCLPSFLQFFL